MKASELQQLSPFKKRISELQTESDLILLTNTEFDIAWVSQDYLNHIHSNLDEVLNSSYIEHHSHKGANRQDIEKLIEHQNKQAPLELELWLRKQKNELYFAFIRIIPILSEENFLLGYEIREKDITSEKLQEVSKLSSRTQRLAGLGSWSVDLETNTPIWSDEVKRIHEVPLDYEPDMESAINFYTPEVRPIVTQYVSEAIEKKRPFEFTLPFITAKGRHIMVHSIGEPKVENGITVGLSGFFRDVTVEFQNERKLKELSDRLQVATETAKIGIWEWDIDNDLLEWNDIMYSLYGLDPQEYKLTFRNWLKCICQEDQARVEAEILQASQQHQQDLETEFSITWPNGTNRNIKAFAKVKRNDQGLPIRMIGTNWDITQEKNSLKELTKAREKAEVGMRVKNEFLSMMSHELRTPMNAVIGMANILSSTHLDTEQKQYVSTLEDSAETMMSILKDILDYSRFDSKTFELSLGPCYISHLVEDSIQHFQRFAKEKEIGLFHDIQEDPYQIMADTSRVQQIVNNLIENAIKFSEQGFIKIKYRSKAVSQKKIEIYVEVEDEGVGIPQEKHEEVFKTFSQADLSLTRKFGGTGMGLAICKRLVEIMNGQIGFISEENKGSSFWFKIKLEMVQEPKD